MEGECGRVYRADRQHFRFNYYPDDMGNRVGDRWVITCEPEWREEGKNSRSECLARGLR